MRTKPAATQDSHHQRLSIFDAGNKMKEKLNMEIVYESLKDENKVEKNEKLKIGLHMFYWSTRQMIVLHKFMDCQVNDFLFRLSV